MNTKQLIRKLAVNFPKRYAKMNHDYVGLMTGKLPEEVHKVHARIVAQHDGRSIADKRGSALQVGRY